MAACTAALSLGAVGVSESKHKDKLLQSSDTVVLGLWRRKQQVTARSPIVYRYQVAVAGQRGSSPTLTVIG